MKNTMLALTLSTALFSARPLFAADSDSPLEVPWNQLCQATNGHELTVTTTDGGTIQGYCAFINVNEMSIRTNKTPAKIARTALAKIEMRRSKGSQVKSLLRGMKQGLHEGVGLLFSPFAPAGLVVVPGTIAWGAIAMPFCLLGDLGNLDHGTREVKVT